jgi:hypothetical protein
MLLLTLTFERILVPMDETQTNHLKAYGLAYWSVKNGFKTWWILNYRGGSFMMEFNKDILVKASKMGVYVENLNQSEVSEIYSIVEKKNMEIVELVRAPKVAVYAPPYNRPWDDAVELALNYAEIPYDRIWDEEILNGKVMEYDWLHLHHEDFTGMLGKFWASYQFTDWYQNMEKINLQMAKKLGFKDIPSLKKTVARKIRDFVVSGKFLFAMCAAPITLDIALASQNVDIADVPFDGTPTEPNYNNKLDYSQTFAFKDFKVISDPYIYEHSDIDITRESALRGPDSYFELFEFSAKFDIIPTILTQDHTSTIKEFLGQDTGFKRDKIKDNVIILADVPGTDEVKYIYGTYGKGFFSFLGGHDPEDYQHFVGEPPTDLSKFPNSPGYRLILNNVLLPSTKRKPLKT